MAPQINKRDPAVTASSHASGSAAFFVPTTSSVYPQEPDRSDITRNSGAHHNV